MTSLSFITRLSWLALPTVLLLTWRVGALNRRVELIRDNAHYDCGARQTDDCRKMTDMFFDCPETCAHSLRERLNPVIGRVDRDQYLELEIETESGNTMTIEEASDGYAVLLLVTSLQAGMTQYYYELTEYLAEKYQYELMTMVLTLDPKPSYVTAEIERQANGRSLFLKQVNDGYMHPVVRFFFRSVEHIRQSRFAGDKVSFFAIGQNGIDVQYKVAPTKAELDGMLKEIVTRTDEAPDL